MIVAERYELDEKIGEGGMGAVYLGRDSQTGLAVAVKALKHDATDEDALARFEREGEMLRQLHHPNIVMMLDTAQENGQHYLVMELVEGGSLAQLIAKQSPLSISRILSIALDLSDALTRAHRLNIIHRDLKPANVLIAADGTPRLTDFGIARMRDSEITKTGMIVGTLAYLSPELFNGGTADPLSDIWAFGMVLFEMLTGKLPFETDSASTLIHSILSEPLPDLEVLRTDAPIALIDLVYRMTAKNPAERIPSVRLVGAEIEAMLRGSYITPHAALSSSKLASLVEDLPTIVGTSPFAISTPSQPSVRNNLPNQTTPFVGREHEMEELHKLLGNPQIQLVTILGMGGVGKTRLSQETAGGFLGNSDCADGVFFVELAPLDAPENIVTSVAEAVGYPFQLDDRDQQQQLIDYFREKRQLLIMDNFEHLLAGRTLVNDILRAAPQVKILVTSRERLNLTGETIFNLEGMAFPTWETPADALEYAAVKLFLQSALRVQPAFELQADDLPSVARICRLVEGFPLGILLAAAWLEVLPLSEIAEEIANSLDFLSTSMHDIPERQRSVRAVFEYSWNLMTPAEQQIFEQLSIFRGGFDRQAVQHITGANLRDLVGLVNKSLLRRDAISGRYQIHELLRQFAEERLIESGAAEASHSAHSLYYLNLLHQLTDHLKDRRQITALDNIESDFENIRAAWNWGVDHGQVQALEGALESLYLYCHSRGQFKVGEELFRHARSLCQSQTDHASLVGKLLVRFPDEYSAELYEHGLDIAQKTGERAEIAFCLHRLGHWLSHRLNQHDEGIALMEESLTIYEMLEDQFYVAQIYDDMAYSHSLLGRPQKRIELAEKSLAIRRTIGDQIGEAHSLRHLGAAYVEYENVKSGMYWEQALEIARKMGDRLSIAWNSVLVCITYMGRPDAIEISTPLLNEGYQLATELNQPVIKGMANCAFAGMALTREDFLTARTHLQEIEPAAAKDLSVQMNVDWMMSLVMCGLGDFEAAKPYARNTLQHGMSLQSNFNYFAGILATALILAHTGKPETALQLFAAYFSHPAPTGNWAETWAFTRSALDGLKESLSDASYQAAWDRGAVLDIPIAAQLAFDNLS